MSRVIDAAARSLVWTAGALGVGLTLLGVGCGDDGFPAAPPAPPRIVSPDNGSVLNDSTPRVGGEADPDVRIELLDEDDHVLGSVDTDDGDWSITSSELQDGEHELTAVAIAGEHSRSDPSDPITITIDTQPPDAPEITDPEDEAVLTDRRPDVSGRAEAGSRIELFIAGNTVGQGDADEDGRFTLRGDLPSDGRYALTVTATDAAGNQSEPSEPVIVVLDATAPDQPVITAPANGAVTNDATLAIKGTAQAGTTVTVSDEDDNELGSTTAGANGRFSVTSNDLDDGRYTLRAVATDEAGNDSEPSELVTVTIDTVAPDVPTIETPEDGSVVASLSSVSGRAEAGVGVGLYVDGALVGAGSAIGTHFIVGIGALSEGEHALSVVALDDAGNHSPRSSAIHVTIDRTEPEDPVITLGSRTTNVSGVQRIEGTAEPGTVVELFEGYATAYTPLTQANVGDDGTFTLQTPMLFDGSHRFTVVVTDAAGLRSSAAVTIVVDTIAPDPPTISGTAFGNISPTSDIGLSGMVETGARVDVTIDTTTIEADAVTPTFWRAELSGFADGSYTVTAVATDAAGNTSAPSEPFEVLVDSEPPVVEAGDDVIANTSVVIDATVTDLTAVTLGWRKWSGPGTVTFDDDTIEDPMVTADTEGSYVLELTATDAVGRETYDIVTYTFDTTPPTVQVRSPDADESGVGVDRSVRVVLSEPIDAATVAGNFTLDGGSVTATAQAVLGGTVIVLTPSAPLAEDTTYQVDLLAGLTDLAGNSVTPESWSFTTIAAGTPTVEPLYTNGHDWNDYVEDDGLDTLHALNTACDADAAGDYFACVHAAVLRRIDTGDANCNGQTASDALDAFDWVCDDSSGDALMVSTGLKAGKKLSDLVDFTVLAWKPNAVTVANGPGVGYPFTTSSSVWWDNPVLSAHDTSTLDTAGAVYLLAVGEEHPVSIDADRVALVVKPGEYLLGDYYATSATVTVGARRFLWIEGGFGAYFAGPVLHLSGVRMSVLDDIAAWSGEVNVWLDADARRNLLTDLHVESGMRGLVLDNAHDNHLLGASITSGYDGLVLEAGSSGNVVSDIEAFNDETAVLLDDAHDNRLDAIAAVASRGDAVRVQASSNNRLSAIRVSYSNYAAAAGVVLDDAPGTLLSGLAISSSEGVGLACIGSDDVTVDTAMLIGNGGAGLDLDGCTNARIASVTTVNNLGAGVSVSGGAANVLWNVAAVNNGGPGVELSGGTTGNLLVNIASANNESYGASLTAAPDNRFTGELAVGQNGAGDCYVDAESSSGDLRDDAGGLDGTHEGLCATTGTGLSDFVVASGVTAAASFVGKVGTDGPIDATGDDVNPSDDYTPGLGDPSDIEAWTSFEHGFRIWATDGSAFPSANNRGPLSYYLYARIWDFAVNTADAGDGGGPVLWSVLPQPGGNDVIEHAWSLTATQASDCAAIPGSVFAGVDDCRSTFLRDAAELQLDGEGNDNGLCESDEPCLYTPNIGAYQGHGVLQAVGFSDGAVTNVTLLEQADNGY